MKLRNIYTYGGQYAKRFLPVADSVRLRGTHKTIVYEEGRYFLLVASAREQLKTEKRPIVMANVKRAINELDDAMASLYTLVLNSETIPFAENI